MEEGEKTPQPPSASDEESAVYSVWAMPPDHVRERLVKLMGQLRSEFGGPEFEPHVTVVGAIRLTKDDALHKLQSSCSGLKPYAARINTVSKGTFFYQCVYLLLDPTPEVVEPSAHCSSHFGYKNSTPYMPHLSLLYGDLTDEEKDRAVERVKFHDQDICNLSFEVSRLALYKTDTEDKTLKSWEKVADWNLLGGN
ncbi:cyclic phosphodiesterase-like protein [Cinnamomum micranthum f. kanehirae]|uniref:Cyclic phosphodiesterase-like protein n=1 Tax=Cinnamomum micranthum f. kanehirae TaxID=337451 RepID=A0A443P6N5_9MAGN|nr:cyclic phosphodiesterase-like protein [Cinnamomum micranthum f. kanehirae]